MELVGTVYPSTELRCAWLEMRFFMSPLFEGSFGHFHAKQYGLRTGGDGDSRVCSRDTATRWQYGLSLTRQSVLKLNRVVVDVLISKGVPAVAVDPFPSTRTQRLSCSGTAQIIPDAATNMSVVSHPGVLGAIRDLLAAGLVPVLHGDVVLDSSQNCSILSGDSIISWLSHSFHIDSGAYDDLRVVFLTDVAGVFDKAPYLPGAALIPHIFVNEGDASVKSDRTELSALLDDAKTPLLPFNVDECASADGDGCT